MKPITNALVVTCACAALTSTNVHAEKFFGNSSISLLYSDHYEVFGGAQETQTVFTFENATGHNWGDTFLFFDRALGQGSSDDNDTLYGEFAPNLSLSWLTGRNLGFGPLSDIRLSGQYEYGGGAVNNNNLLYGLGLKWDIPGLAYFNTNFYYVDNDTAFDKKDDWQLTVTWKAPIEAGRALIIFDGYIDYSTAASGDQSTEFHFNPQLKLDIGNFAGKPGVLLAGIEYSYWRDKYGNKAFDTESAVSALVKFHF